jgi:hypothetical protein
MADATINFGASDTATFNLSDSINTDYGNALFICQSSSDDDQASYATVSSVNGDELQRSAGFDNKNEVSATYKWNSTSGLGSALPKVGAIQGSAVVTSINVDSTNDDFPTITISGHLHDTNSHDTVANTPATFSWPSSTPDVVSVITGAFGAYDFLVVSDTGSSGAAVASSSVTFECDHEDVNGALGEHLAGENYNGRLSVSQTCNGQPDAVDTASNWNITSDNASRENTGFETVAYSAEIGVARD